MNYPIFLLASKGFFHLIYRFFLILKRFGFSPRKISKNLYTILEIINKYEAGISLNITAVVLDRHPSLIKDLNKKGIEFGAHGYVHTNYNTLSLNDQIEGLKKSKEIFKRHQVPLYGFRAPYLSYNNDTLKAIKECGFFWSSNQVIDWEVLDQNNYTEAQWKTYQRLLHVIYKPKSCSDYSSLPAMNGGFLEIPISIPDDEIMVDRLQIRNSDEISEVWQKIFEQTQKRGELFTLQLHHERLDYYKRSLESILKQASVPESKVWLATLKEITDWWKEKSDYKFEFISQGNKEYRVICNCSKRASVLVKNLISNTHQKTFFNGYKFINARDFIVESSAKPCIGLSPNSPIELVKFLKDEGFATEVNQNKDHYALYLDNYKNFSEKNKLELISSIENSSSPLVRYWRWPNENISALSITGDIDSITLWDFVIRFFEF